jgi:hypothetical protein
MGQVLAIATYNLVLPDDYDQGTGILLGGFIGNDFGTILNVLISSPIMTAASNMVNLELVTTYLNSIGYANSVALDAMLSSTGVEVASSQDLSDVDTNITIIGFAKFDQ